MRKIAWVSGAVLCIVIGFVGFLWVTEFRPAPVEGVELKGNGEKKLSFGDSLTLLSWNIGYGGIGAEQDFFMDGGKMVYPKEKAVIEKNLAGIQNALAEMEATVYFFQEMDIDAKRSHYINQRLFLEETLQMGNTYADNFKCAYVPYPMPPIGKVEGGIATFTELQVNEAERIALPNPFSWPMRMANLKRCMLVNRVAVEDRELVLVNVHLEAYDDGAGKIAQTKMLMEFMKEEYKKGNYVIVGGDFNQTFPQVDKEKYSPLGEGYWQPQEMDGDFGKGISVFFDDTAPTCRSLDKPYEGRGEKVQLYVIDGFLVTDNVLVEKVETIELDFQHSDHNPVALKVQLQ